MNEFVTRLLFLIILLGFDSVHAEDGDPSGKVLSAICNDFKPFVGKWKVERFIPGSEERASAVSEVIDNEVAEASTDLGRKIAESRREALVAEERNDKDIQFEVEAEVSDLMVYRLKQRFLAPSFETVYFSDGKPDIYAENAIQKELHIFKNDNDKLIHELGRGFPPLYLNYLWLNSTDAQLLPSDDGTIRFSAILSGGRKLLVILNSENLIEEVKVVQIVKLAEEQAKLAGAGFIELPVSDFRASYDQSNPRVPKTVTIDFTELSGKLKLREEWRLENFRFSDSLSPGKFSLKPGYLVRDESNGDQVIFRSEELIGEGN